MRTRQVPRGLLIAGAIFIVLFGIVGLGAVTMGNDLVCSESEQRTMSEFPHYAAVDPEWDSNLKITGGCTTWYTTQAIPEEVRTYYQEHLTERGWAVDVGPANSFPAYLGAERDGLRFFLSFEGPQSFDSSKQEQEADALERGQTRVSISGGHE